MIDPRGESDGSGETGCFNEKAVFVAALALEGDEREAFLHGACPREADRVRVRKLLERHAEASTQGLRAKAEQADGASDADPGDDGAAEEFALPHRIGDFELRREVGRGGMGVVYLARDLTLDRDVAIKMLEPRFGATSKFLAAFKQEAVLASQLRHPAIVPVFRFGDHEGRPFIVTPYIEGETLRERLRTTSESPVSAPDTRAWRREVARVVATIAEALDRAHAEGIVHRDVKPSNIIIDSAGRPHLLDFGISMRAGDGQSLLPVAQMGSSAYASPEQTDGGPIDGLSDVFSLGVVLFESLTGQRPFHQADRAADAKRALAPHAPHARRVDRSIPVDLDVICQKAMATARDDRYQSAAHVAADLRAWLADRPILARPDPMPRRVGRWVGRHRALVFSSTAAIVALVASAIGFWIAQDPRPRLSLEGVPEDARIVIQPLAVPLGSPDGEPFEVGERTRLDPGWYRIVVIGGDGAQAEFSRWLAPESTTRLAVRPVARSKAIEGMVRFDPAEHPPHPTSVSFPGASLAEPFWIDRREVSNAQYEAFVLDPATDVPPPPHWNGPRCPEHWRDLPVVGITWAEARAYAEWAGKRLPTIAEWLHAASGSEGRRYTTTEPVGSAADLGVIFVGDAPGSRVLPSVQSATIPESWMAYQEHVRPVHDPGGGFADRTPEGLLNMYGNVREWTDSVPFHEDGLAPARMIMGFCWQMRGREPVSMAVTREQPIEFRIIGTGLRCARSEPTPSDTLTEATP